MEQEHEGVQSVGESRSGKLSHDSEGDLSVLSFKRTLM